MSFKSQHTAQRYNVLVGFENIVSEASLAVTARVVRAVAERD